MKNTDDAMACHYFSSKIPDDEKKTFI